MMHQKGADLLHYYVEKQVFSWRAKISYILCIITLKSRFSHDTPKRCKSVALLCFEAGFLITRQKLLYLMHYYLEKQVFSWRAKKVQICCFITWIGRFSHEAPKNANLLHYYVEKQVFSWRAKTLIFDSLLRGKAGFLMTRQKSANLLLYYVEKQIFSWRAEKVQICCIITFRSRFSHDATVKKVYIWCIITFRSRFPHDAPKTLIFDALLREKSRFSHDAQKRCKFDALLRGKAGFLMMCQKLLYLMHYNVEKQVFSWRAKKVLICCIMTFRSRSRFSHDMLKTLIFDAILHRKARFLMTCQENANLLPYYVEKQVFSWRAKNSYIWCIITWKAGFLMKRQKV